MTRVVENAVILTSADAALLYEHAKLRELRISARGRSDRLYALLVDITKVAQAHSPSVDGTKPTETAEPDEPGSTEVMTVKQVARRVHLTPRAVLNHIRDGLLPATQQGRIWIIRTEAATQYIAGRESA